MEKLLSAINTASIQGLSSTTKRWMYGYKESVYPTHVWLKPNASTHNMTKNERVEIEWF